MISEGPICVVGCNGFVGSHVTAELLSRGFDVHGTVRDDSETNTNWIWESVAPLARDGTKLTLFAAEASDKEALRTAMTGCTGVICCAGSPKQEPETVDLMTALAGNVSDVALELGIGAAVFTSSTGSTNPPDGEPPLKNEVEHWSDAEKQLAAGKYAAAAKTRYDRLVLQKMNASDGRLRSATINPSLIAGPCFQPEPVASLRTFAAIIKGERMGDKIPNSSMSMIDVRDLAKLHSAALLDENASGRYFGIKRSWHWREILSELSGLVPSYQMPDIDPNEIPVTPTAFDLTRQASLGVELRDIREILKAVVEELNKRKLI